MSIELNGEEITPNRKNIEKTMKVENLPLKATCYRNGKVKSMDITSDDLRDFEFGYYSFYLGTVTAIDSNGNFIGLFIKHLIFKQRKIHYLILDI